MQNNTQKLCIVGVHREYKTQFTHVQGIL